VFSASSLSLTLLPFRGCACRSAGLSIRPLLALASVLAAALSLLICRVPRRWGVFGGLFKLPASVSTLSLPGRGVGRLALRLARVGLLSLISAVVSATVGWSGIFRARCRRAWSGCFRASPAWTGLAAWLYRARHPRWLPRLVETRPRLALRRPRWLRFADSYACLEHAHRPLQWRRPRRQVQCAGPGAAAFCWFIHLRFGNGTLRACGWARAKLPGYRDGSGRRTTNDRTRWRQTDRICGCFGSTDEVTFL
jgi:hypothetical protein